jgi:hypothetical protein
MAYVIPIVLVVVLVGGFVTYLVLNATEKSGPAADSGADAPGIGRDDAPLGDTREHAGEVSEDGETTADPESDAVRRSADPDASAHVARPGEAEGEERLEFDREQPRSASERLADRDA